MSFHEVRFPENISLGAKGGPEFNTNILTMISGKEQRNINWSESRNKYDISTNIKSKTRIEELLAFFNARKGRAYGFRFKDWSDYKVAAESLGLGDGIKTDFQLTKTYSNGSEKYVRTINKPVEGTVKVYVDDVEMLAGWAVDSSAGILSFSVAPMQDSVIKADFEFDVPVRFNHDNLEISMNSVNSGQIEKIELVEIKL